MDGKRCWKRGANLIGFVTGIWCRLIELLSRGFRRLFRRLGSLVHLFLGHPLSILSRIGRFALGGTEGMFSGIHHLLAAVDGAGETLSNGLVNLSTALSAKP